MYNIFYIADEKTVLYGLGHFTAFLSPSRSLCLHFIPFNPWKIVVKTIF